MDHHYIEEQNIPDRYLMGKLPPEERTRFEEHFIDCRECLDRLETTEDFRHALRSVAVDDATRGYLRAGLLARIGWIARLSDTRRAALLIAAILILMSLPTALWLKERGRALENQSQSMTPYPESQRQSDDSQQRSDRLQRELRDSQRQSAERQRQLEAQLERERKERARLAEELEKLKRPRGAAQVFVLSLVRSGGTGAPINRIILPRSAPRMTLSPELEPTPDLKSYRATLTLLTAEDRRIWSAGNLRLNSKDQLNISLSAGLLKPGDYLLTLEGLTLQGSYTPIGKYPFQIIKQ